LFSQISSSGSLTVIEDGAISGGQLERSLVALKLAGNGFESLPDEISELRNLQSLDLSENRIRDLSGAALRSLDALEDLNLGHNQLTELNGASLPRSLRTLNVQNNQVKIEKKLMKNNYLRN
jgi:Leucine-rich repeat (LRR) protein